MIEIMKCMAFLNGDNERVDSTHVTECPFNHTDIYLCYLKRIRFRDPFYLSSTSLNKYKLFRA